jgi:hypothetical protein
MKMGNRPLPPELLILHLLDEKPVYGIVQEIDETISCGGAPVAFRADNASYNCKNLSLREIRGE